MKLTDLDPEFHMHETKERSDPGIAPPGGNFGDKRIAESLVITRDFWKAQSLMFDCPKCPSRHKILVGFHDRGLLPSEASHNKEGQPSRWHLRGTCFADMSLTPSIDTGCWHGFITGGLISTC